MALITVAELQQWGNFTAKEFDWEKGQLTDLHLFLARVIDEASALLRADVGEAMYGTSEAVAAAGLKAAERYLALALALERRMTVLASHAEEGPPAEYTDLGQLERQIVRYRRLYEVGVGAYRVGDGGAGGAFAVEATAPNPPAPLP
jgi:hypothetical protein